MAFHGKERLPVLLANVINRADVWMVQRGCGLRFALKAGERQWVVSNFIGQELEGDKTVQSCVLGLINNPHPATTELFYDAVVRDNLADHQGQILRGRNRQVNERRGEEVERFETALITEW